MEREAKSGPKPGISAVFIPKIFGQMTKFFTLIIQLSMQPKMLIGRFYINLRDFVQCSRRNVNPPPETFAVDIPPQTSEIVGDSLTVDSEIAANPNDGEGEYSCPSFVFFASNQVNTWYLGLKP